MCNNYDSNVIYTQKCLPDIPLVFVLLIPKTDKTIII